MSSAEVDRSAGYEALAAEFMRRRSPVIGVATVQEWARGLVPSATVLDLGCGHGVPISEALLEAGCRLYAVDAAPAMVAAYRERFPTAEVACEAVENSGFFGRKFDAVIAWGLVFLLEPSTQLAVFHRIAAALDRGGRFLFTAPEQSSSWTDVLTGRESISLGSIAYQDALAAAGFELLAEREDEGGNHYYSARKA